MNPYKILDLNLVCKNGFLGRFEPVFQNLLYGFFLFLFWIAIWTNFVDLETQQRGKTKVSEWLFDFLRQVDLLTIF